MNPLPPFKVRCLAVLLAACAALPSTYAQSDLDTELSNIMMQYNLVGMVAAAQCADQEPYAFYGGFRNLQNQSLIDENTYFRVASISKAFTAVGLMLLHEEGLFELDDDISDAMGFEVRNPSFPDIPITYRMLLSHTASVQDGDSYGSFLGATVSSNNPPNISHILIPGGSFYAPNIWRLEPPGTHFAYSNLCYGLIGTLIEKLSGMRFDQFQNEHVLGPLGIPGSFNVADIEDIENLSPLYRNSVAQVDNFQGNPPPPFDGSQYENGSNGLRFGPQGGLRSTLNGLIRFGEMLVNYGDVNGESFLDSSSVAMMMDAQWTYNGSNGDNFFGLFNSWGLGIHRSLGLSGNGTGDAIIPNTLMLGHAGEAYGLISSLFVHPESSYVQVFMTNGYTSGGNYAFGVNSTWYRVEEEVFESLESHGWDECQSLMSYNSVAHELKECKANYLPGAKVIRFEQDAPGTAELWSVDGRLLWHDRIAPQEVLQLPNLQQGVYIMRFLSENGTEGLCSLKFFVH